MSVTSTSTNERANHFKSIEGAIYIAELSGVQLTNTHTQKFFSKKIKMLVQGSNVTVSC